MTRKKALFSEKVLQDTENKAVNKRGKSPFYIANNNILSKNQQLWAFPLFKKIKEERKKDGKEKL